VKVWEKVRPMSRTGEGMGEMRPMLGF